MAMSEKQIEDLINKKLADLEVRFKKELDSLKDLKNVNTVLKKKVDLLEKSVNTLETNIIVMSKDLELTKRATYINDQYQRRNNIEFSGIPDTIDDDDLEDFCCRLVNDLISDPDGSNEIDVFDIEACHRLRTINCQGTKNTIIRFTNRKICDEIFINKHKIKNIKMEHLGETVCASEIYVNENICSYFKELGAKSRRLFKRRKVTDSWTSFGTVKIKLKDGTVKIITHQADLDKLFPDFVYFNT